MIIKEFEEENFMDNIKEGIVLVDFFATWCGPCKMLSPEIEDLVNEMPDLKVFKIDIDKYKKLTNDFRIMSVPTLILYNNGNSVGNRSGYMPKSILKEWINESIKWFVFSWKKVCFVLLYSYSRGVYEKNLKNVICFIFDNSIKYG